MLKDLLRAVLAFFAVWVVPAWAGTRTWDDRYDTEQIEVSVVYFVPSDRQPLPDWRDRVDYYCQRIKRFHDREFQGQSTLTTLVQAEPLVSKASTAELRLGNADAIFFRTLREADRYLKFGQGKRKAFPILLVLSDINWRPLDDFFRLHPEEGKLVFEGNLNRGEHFPGASSGGARASYLADRGVGWGLVSADGWRVPYRGSDCVVYHEGCGHTVGLPHPQPGNGSVMSLGQYRGWLSESWLDKEQKSRLGWKPRDVQPDGQTTLYSTFRALPEPRTPRPGQEVRLAFDWPSETKVKSLRVRLQTSIESPWIELPQSWIGDTPAFASLGEFDRPSPVSYRVDATLEQGPNVELWGYFQVRSDPSEPPQPVALSGDLKMGKGAPIQSEDVAVLPSEQIDLLELADPGKCWSVGEWSRSDGKLQSPKRFGARLELPYSPPKEYRLSMIVEPLDPPNGLLIGQRLGQNRFVTLFNYMPGKIAVSAIENIDGLNVGNETTFEGNLFRKNRLAQVIVTVENTRVTMSVDGHRIANWIGSPERLSLGDYWKTPNESAIFFGAYDCRYRFHQITLEPIKRAD